MQLIYNVLLYGVYLQGIAYFDEGKGQTKLNALILEALSF